MRRFAVAILMVLILPLTACTITAGDHRHGGYAGHYPPPAHGHWRWDDDLRVYVSVGYPRIYYHDHTYYRWHDSRWSSGRYYNGPWRVIEHRHVPPRLGHRHAAPPPRHDNRYRDNRFHDNRRYDSPRPDERHWNERRYERRDGNRERDDDRSDRRHNPGPRDWQNLRERRDAEQRFQHWPRREAGRDGHEPRMLQPREQGRHAESPRVVDRQQRQALPRDLRSHEPRAEHLRQERRAVSQSRSREVEQDGQRGGRPQGGGYWQERGER